MILVTGGAGFIGSILVQELNRRGRSDIFIVDCLDGSAKWQNLRGLKYENYLHADDFMLPENVDHFRYFTQIIHFGACSSTTEKDTNFLFKNNVHFSQKLATKAIELGVPFIYASSAATYGKGENGYSDDHSHIDKLRPLNPYGYSKHFFDQWMLSRREQPEKWYGIKFFNVFGPNEFHKGSQRSVVHQAFEQVRDKGQVNLFKSYRKDFRDGEQLRDFVYVKDCIKAVLALIDKQAPSGIYNMGTGQAQSFKDLAVAVFKAMGKEERIQYIDMPAGLNQQYQYYTQADMGKFRQAIPGFAFSSLEEAVTDYIQGHLIKSDL